MGKSALQQSRHIAAVAALVGLAISGVHRSSAPTCCRFGSHVVARMSIVVPLIRLNRPFISLNRPSNGGHRSRQAFEDHQLRLLTCAAEAWDMKETAMDVLAREGLSFTDDKGMIRARPEAAIARDSRAAFMRAVAQLKLDTPPPDEARIRNNGRGLGVSYLDLPPYVDK